MVKTGLLILTLLLERNSVFFPAALYLLYDVIIYFILFTLDASMTEELVLMNFSWLTFWSFYYASMYVGMYLFVYTYTKGPMSMWT